MTEADKGMLEKFQKEIALREEIVSFLKGDGLRFECPVSTEGVLLSVVRGAFFVPDDYYSARFSVRSDTLPLWEEQQNLDQALENSDIYFTDLDIGLRLVFHNAPFGVFAPNLTTLEERHRADHGLWFPIGQAGKPNEKYKKAFEKFSELWQNRAQYREVPYSDSEVESLYSGDMDGSWEAYWYGDFA